ncbi:MAG: hypothetical protein AB9866_18590 [Syntrophobacteraceae bacterium]
MKILGGGVEEPLPFSLRLLGLDPVPIRFLFLLASLLSASMADFFFSFPKQCRISCSLRSLSAVLNPMFCPARLRIQSALLCLIPAATRSPPVQRNLLRSVESHDRKRRPELTWGGRPHHPAVLDLEQRSAGLTDPPHLLWIQRIELDHRHVGIAAIADADEGENRQDVALELPADAHPPAGEAVAWPAEEVGPTPGFNDLAFHAFHLQRTATDRTLFHDALLLKELTPEHEKVELPSWLNAPTLRLPGTVFPAVLVPVLLAAPVLPRIKIPGRPRPADLTQESQPGQSQESSWHLSPLSARAATTQSPTASSPIAQPINKPRQEPTPRAGVIMFSPVMRWIGVGTA